MIILYPIYRDTGTNAPIWIKRTKCNGDEPHILRCKNEIVHGAERVNANTCNDRERILLNCSEQKIL